MYIHSDLIFYPFLLPFAYNVDIANEIAGVTGP